MSQPFKEAFGRSMDILVFCTVTYMFGNCTASIFGPAFGWCAGCFFFAFLKERTSHGPDETV